ncbi:MAG: phosphoribosylaminoimidazolesuccinocarboxamide synthase [Pirellulaceae bacterium]|nr:phosphoribosylaminoimidazolesuccinocarboxamide synthase [Pirellulaceae bacterium]
MEPTRSGKVRDVYDLGDRLLLVASDRISAFDWILEPAIPDKGRVLTQLSNFWFSRLSTANHLLETDIIKITLPAGLDRDLMAGRAVLVKKCDVVPFECVVRGYLVGSGWKDYRATGQVCGIDLPPGLPCAAKLERPLFTPATKAETGHDENVSFTTMVAALGADVAQELQRRSVEIYEQGRDYAATRGIIIADTKLEWGWHDGQLILIDEVLTPDSSRFWPADAYRVGSNPPSYDKQFVRDYLETTTWDKNSPPPRLPAEIVQHTRLKYIEAAERLMGQPFAWR